MTTSAEEARLLRKIPAVAAALKKVDETWAPDLKEYIDSLPVPGGTLGSKAIKDSVWGMITLRGEEVLVVDSPVVQRLRRIKQLGTTFFTFPTADYSRFEHSLGVLHQGERMIAAIKERSKNQGEVERARPAIRLACLLHDIGHLPLSHLAERHFEDFPDQLFKDCRDSIEEHFQGSWKNDSLSELLSFLIVESETYRGFLVGHCRYDSEDVDSAALAIIGYPPPGRPFIKQMISNVIDADKLDYMFRDSHYTSVPLPVDLDRLLYKLKLLEAGRKTEDGRSVGGCLALDLGGSHLIEDLIVARRILSRQVYRHHKTLAAEQLVLASLGETRPTVADLLTREDEYFFGMTRRKSVPEETSTPDQIFRELRTRRLPRRAFAYGHALLPRELNEEQKPVVSDALKKADLTFNEKLQLQDERKRLGTEALEIYRQLCTLLGRSVDSVRAFYFDKNTQLNSPEIELFVERPDDSLLTYDGFAPKAAAFAHSPEDSAYAFFSGKREATGLAFVACETVLYDRFRLQYTRGSADYAKIDFSHVEATKREVEAADPKFYSQRWPLRPRSAWARAAAGHDQLQKLSEKLRNRRGAPRAGQIQAFLDQFPEALVPIAMRMLQGVQLIDDIDSAARTKEHFSKSPDSERIFVPLTPMGQSSSLMSYDLRKNKLRVSEQSDALRSGAKSVVFFEDSLLSGKQARSIFQSWFGLPIESQDDAVPTLTEEQRNWLRNADVSLLFFVSRPEGEKSLGDLLKTLHIGRKTSDGLPVINSMGTAVCLSDLMKPQEVAPLEEFLEEVGVELLRQTKGKSNPEKWTEDRIRKCALGYSGSRSLTIFRQNTPTSTLTPLWLGGTFRGSKWEPLFSRIEEKTIIDLRDKQTSTTTGR